MYLTVKSHVVIKIDVSHKVLFQQWVIAVSDTRVHKGLAPIELLILLLNQEISVLHISLPFQFFFDKIDAYVGFVSCLDHIY